MTISENLAAAIDWADVRLRSGTEPPWAYYRLMQLKEAATELLAGITSTSVSSEANSSSDVVRLDVARRLSNPDKPVLPA